MYCCCRNVRKIGVNVNLFSQTKSKHFKELKDNQGDFYMLGWGVPTLDSHVFHYLYETDASWNKVISAMEM